MITETRIAMALGWIAGGATALVTCRIGLDYTTTVVFTIAVGFAVASMARLYPPFERRE